MLRRLAALSAVPVNITKSIKQTAKARAAHLKGRGLCGCGASVDRDAVPASGAGGAGATSTGAAGHVLFANCTVCGRIHCEKEGEGPCFYCHSFVTKQGTTPAPEFSAREPAAATAGTTLECSIGLGVRVSWLG